MMHFKTKWCCFLSEFTNIGRHSGTTEEIWVFVLLLEFDWCDCRDKSNICEMDILPLFECLGMNQLMWAGLTASLIAWPDCTNAAFSFTMPSHTSALVLMKVPQKKLKSSVMHYNSKAVAIHVIAFKWPQQSSGHTCLVDERLHFQVAHQNRTIGWKTLPNLMSRDFCCDVQKAGSQFGINNMKAWTHCTLWQFRLVLV